MILFFDKNSQEKNKQFNKSTTTTTTTTITSKSESSSLPPTIITKVSAFQNLNTINESPSGPSSPIYQKSTIQQQH